MLPILATCSRSLAGWGLLTVLRGSPCVRSITPSIKMKGALDLAPDSAFQRAFLGHTAFRNERQPTALDRKILLWTKRFKKEEDIPKLISVEVLKAAHSQLRIRVCYIMIALTLLGCVAMVVSGKLAAKRNDTLLKMNAEKKAKWRMEREKEEK